MSLQIRAAVHAFSLPSSPVQVGVYIDGFNLYYGGRGLCGRSTPGWRWLDLRVLAGHLVANCSTWTGAQIERVVYCTAMISGADNPVGNQEQDVYLRALRRSQSTDHIELGNYVHRIARAPLATPDQKGRPILAHPSGPIMVKGTAGHDDPSAVFMVSTARREEKGSDVNVAAHLLLDILEQRIDAAIVISNDSDLKLPVQAARDRIPVGIVNPSANQTAGKLRGTPATGVGNHWWHQLTSADFGACQLPDPAGGVSKPPPW